METTAAPAIIAPGQQDLDLDLAMMLQALQDGAGDELGIPDIDEDTVPEIFECICGDSFTTTRIIEGRAVLLTPCGHARCMECLNENVEHGLSSKREYPPKCCGAIDMDNKVQYLQEDVRARWAEVRLEFEDTAPVYCAVKECSKYLTKDVLVEDGRWTLCDKCNKKTCTGCLCLKTAHVDGAEECPERISKMDRDFMQKKGWKACPECKEMIERIEGCDHMICVCGQEFCYSCGGKNGGGMPCNCEGQREWVDDDPDVNDPAAQQQIMDNIRNGWDQHEDDDDNTQNEDDVEGDIHAGEGVIS